MNILIMKDFRIEVGAGVEAGLRVAVARLQDPAGDLPDIVPVGVERAGDLPEDVESGFVELEEFHEGIFVHDGVGRPLAAQGEVGERLDVVADAFQVGHAAVDVLGEDGLALGEAAADEPAEVILHGQLDFVDGLLVEPEGLEVPGRVGEENGSAGEAQAAQADLRHAAQFAEAGGDGLFGVGQQGFLEVRGFRRRDAGGDELA